MKKYRLTYTRSISTSYYLDVEAKNKADARKRGDAALIDGDDALTEVVDSDDIDEVKLTLTSVEEVDEEDEDD